MENDRETSPNSSGKNSRNTATGMHCMAPGCTNSRKNNTEVHYHRFPLRNKPLLKQLMAKSKLAKPPRLFFARRLCGQHFTPDDYQTKGQFDDCGRYYISSSDCQPQAHCMLFLYMVCPIPLLVGIINVSIKELTSWVLVEQ